MSIDGNALTAAFDAVNILVGRDIARRFISLE